MAIEDVVDVAVEVASDGGPLTASPTWVDRTADVLAGSTIRATRGRQSEQADASPGSASFTLRDVSDSATGLIGRRARVTAHYLDGSANLLPAADQSMTTGFDWVADYQVSSVALATSPVYEGTHSLAITVSTAEGVIRWPTSGVDGVLASPGERFTATAWVRCDTDSSWYAVIRGLAWDSGGSSVGVSGQTVVDPIGQSTWTLLSSTFTVPEGAAFVGIALNFGNIANNTVIHVDQAGLFRVNPVWAGHVTDADEEWDGSLTRLLSVRAVGPLEVLSRNEMPGVFSEAMRQAQPLLWWPLDDPAGSTQAREANGWAPLVPVQVAGTAGTVDFGAGPVFDESLWTAITPASATDGKGLRVGLTGVTGDADHSFALIMATPTVGRGIVHFYGPAVSPFLSTQFNLEYSGKVSLIKYDSSGTVYTTGTSFGDGSPHLLVATYDAASTTMSLYADGVLQGTMTAATKATPYSEILVSHVPGAMFNGNVSHIAVFSRCLDADEVGALWSAAEVSLASAQTGFERFGVLLAAAGVGSTMRETAGTSAVTLLSQPVKGASATNSVSAVGIDEAGVLTESAAGAVVLHGRDVRADHTPDLTLDARYDVVNDFRVRTGTSGLVNDATVTRDAGNTFTSVNQRSVDDHGRRTVSETSYSDSDDHAEELAGWLANRNALPSPRSDQIVLDMETMHRRGLLASVLLLDVSSLVEVTQLPGGGSLLLDVEGFDDEITPGSWRRTLRVSPHFVPARLDEGYLLDATGTRLGLVGG